MVACSTVSMHEHVPTEALVPVFMHGPARAVAEFGLDRRDGSVVGPWPAPDQTRCQNFVRVPIAVSSVVLTTDNSSTPLPTSVTIPSMVAGRHTDVMCLPLPVSLGDSCLTTASWSYQSGRTVQTRKLPKTRTTARWETSYALQYHISRE